METSLFDFQTITISTTEKIKEKYLKDFFYTSLENKNIKNYRSQNILYVYLEESNLYEIILSNSKNSFIFELLVLKYQKIKKGIDAYIFRNFFLIYKDSQFYFYKNVEENFPKEEILFYIKNTLKLTIDNYYTLRVEDIILFEKEFDINKHRTIKSLKKQKSYSFYFYISYLLFLIFCSISYFYYDDLLPKKEIKNKVKIENYFFLSKKINLLNKDIREFKIEVKDLTLNKNRLKLVFYSKKRKNLFLFLRKYENDLSKTYFKFDDNLKAYESKIDVHISK